MKIKQIKENKENDLFFFDPISYFHLFHHLVGIFDFIFLNFFSYLSH